jgi:hypothetical protein
MGPNSSSDNVAKGVVYRRSNQNPRPKLPQEPAEVLSPPPILLPYAGWEFRTSIAGSPELLEVPAAQLMSTPQGKSCWTIVFIIQPASRIPLAKSGRSESVLPENLVKSALIPLKA